MQYILSNGLVIEVGENYELPYVSIERMVMSVFGFQEDLTQKGLAIWNGSPMSNGQYVSARDESITVDELEAFAAENNCHVLNILDDLAIAQALVKHLDLVVEPVILRNGSLIGLWRVSRLSSFDPFNHELHGVIVGSNEPVATESPDLLQALYGTACRVMGVGKQAYVHFPHGADGRRANILACDFEHAARTESLLNSLVRAPELDRFLTSVIPEAVREQAVEEARLVYAANNAESPEAGEEVNNTGSESSTEATH